MIPQALLVILRLGDPRVLGELYDQVCWETENKGRKMVEGDGRGFRRGGRRSPEGSPPQPAPEWHGLLEGLGFDALYEILDAIQMVTSGDGKTVDAKVRSDVFKPRE